MPLPDDPAAPAAGTDFLLQHLGPQPERIADQNRAAEVPFADADECQGPHRRAVQAQAAADREDQQAVGDWLVERRRLGELVVHVDGAKIAAEAGEVDDVGLGHGPAQRFPLLADFHVIEVEMLAGKRHGRYS